MIAQLLAAWLDVALRSPDMTGVAAIATAVTAVGAFAAALFSWLGVRNSRRADSITRTLELLDGDSANYTVDAVNAYLTTLGLRGARRAVNGKFRATGELSREENEQARNIASYIAYASELLDRRIIERRFFLDRASVAIAHALYIFEGPIAAFLHKTVRPKAAGWLCRACIAVARNRIECEGEIADFELPKGFPYER